MKRARIVAHPQHQHGHPFWYVLVEVDGVSLQYASAPWLWMDPSHVDPDGQRATIASLNAWALENGWTVVT